jgi:hypothetical protein
MAAGDVDVRELGPDGDFDEIGKFFQREPTLKFRIRPSSGWPDPAWRFIWRPSIGWHNLVFPIRKKQDTKFTRKKSSKKFHSHADPFNPPFPCHSERKRGI